MTLVAGVSVGGMPSFIGDLLISWRLPSPADLPTRREEAIQPGFDSHFAAGLAQKLVIVRSYFLLAWAGSRSNANRILAELDRVLPGNYCDLDDTSVVRDILNSCSDGSELVALLIYRDGVHPLGVRTCGFEIGGKRVYILGSGGPAFLQYLETHPETLPGEEFAEDVLARAMALRFGARAMTTQWITGSGLETSWGGGFEVAYPEPDGFKKVDKVLFRGWLIDGSGHYHNSGRSFFIRYYHGDLYLSCFNPGEKTYIIHSPVGERGIPTSFERVHPVWTVDMFLHEPTASLVEFVRFQPEHRPARDFVELVDGMLAGWNMDKGFVEDCVAMAGDQAKQGAAFKLFRY